MLSAPGGDIYKLYGQCRFVLVRNNAAGLRCLCAAVNVGCNPVVVCQHCQWVPQHTAHSTLGMDWLLCLHYKQTRIRTSHDYTDDSSP